jgi:hypothetical protein
MMVGSWLGMVSFEVHINGRRVSEPVWEDKGKAMVPESENEKDPKRARMLLSKGREVAGPDYLRLSGDVARVADRGEESGNPNRVDRVHKEYNLDRRQIRLLRTARVTGMNTRVDGQTGLLVTTGVTWTTTRVSGQIGYSGQPG